MQSIQLYIEDQRVELFADESVSLTQTIQNVKDIGSIFTDFSKSFSVPASKSNNLIFKHYYNSDIDAAYSFIANDTVSARIELNWRTFRKGFIALDGVQMKDNKAYAYKVTFFGETIDLKNKLKETKLSTVFQGVGTYDHTYNVSNVKTGLSSSLFSGKIKYPLISHSERFFFDSGSHNTGDRNLHYDETGGGSGSHNHGVQYTDLKPAIRLDAILDAIEDYADIEFERSGQSFFNSTTNFIINSFYLWMSRVKGPIGLNVSGTASINMPITSINFSNASPNQWDPTNQGSVSTTAPYSRFVDGLWTVRAKGLDMFGGGTGHYYEATFTVVTSQQVTIQIEDASGTVLASASGTGTLSIVGALGTNLWLYGETKTARFRVTSTDPAVAFTPTIQFLYRTFGGGSSTNYITTVTGSDIAPNGAVSDIVVADQMPDIKVVDFLTGIFKMFNLTAFVQDDGKIMVQKLDTFYSGGTEYDISEFVETTNSQIDFAIPYQEIAFRYQKPQTFLSINFNEINNKVFGDLENATTDSADVETSNRGNKYVVTLPFGKMLYERLNDLNGGALSLHQYGYCTDKDQNPTNIAPLMLLIDNQTTGYNTSLSFYNGTSTGTAAKLTSYNMPSNVWYYVSGSAPNTLNFGEEIDEYEGTVNSNSLFEKFYKNYIVDTFDSRRRLTKITAYLPLRILLNYTLADTFVINNRKYKINSITTDLKSGKSELELLNEI